MLIPIRAVPYPLEFIESTLSLLPCNRNSCTVIKACKRLDTNFFLNRDIIRMINLLDLELSKNGEALYLSF